MADDPRYLPVPIRDSKRVMRLPSDMTEIPFDGRQGGGDSDKQYSPAQGMRTLSRGDYEQNQVALLALRAGGLTDYISIKLKGRGADGIAPLSFDFLINPETISINHQVVDADSLTRGGPQVGIWGETTNVTISGCTAGQYFAGQLVDVFGEYSMSYHNFMQLVQVYENNGAWFEGEAVSNDLGGMGSNRQIQIHADVELRFGNFIWSGCFTEMSVDDTADSPFYNKFTMGFMVWRERYADSSPWRNSLASGVSTRGHAYESSSVQAALQAKRNSLGKSMQSEASGLPLIPTSNMVFGGPPPPGFAPPKLPDLSQSFSQQYLGK